MSGKPGPETRLIKKMRDAAKPLYGSRLVVTKYHGSEFGEAGVSDLFGVCDSIMFACEVKAIENYGNNPERALSKGPTFKQRLYLQRVAEAGGVATVACSVEMFLETLRLCVEREVGWHDFRAEPRGVLDQ